MFSSFRATQGVWSPHIPTCDMGYSKQDPLEELLELKVGCLDEMELKVGCWRLISWWWSWMWMVTMVDHGWSWMIIIDSELVTPWQELISKQTAARLQLHETVASGLPQRFLEPSWTCWELLFLVSSSWISVLYAFIILQYPSYVCIHIFFWWSLASRTRVCLQMLQKWICTWHSYLDANSALLDWIEIGWTWMIQNLFGHIPSRTLITRIVIDNQSKESMTAHSLRERPCRVASNLGGGSSQAITAWCGSQGHKGIPQSVGIAVSLPVLCDLLTHTLLFSVGPPQHSSTTLCIHHPFKCAQVVWGQRELAALSAQEVLAAAQGCATLIQPAPDLCLYGGSS